MSSLGNLWKNEYFKTIIAIVIIISIVLGFLVGLQLVLHTSNAALTVESSSMCIPYNYVPGPPYTLNDFLWALEHPFDRTLNVGDIVIVQGVNPKDLNINYPNSDIIIFHSPDDYNTLIIHRIVNVTYVNGEEYFITKGDGNGNPWPQTPTTGFDPWDYDRSPPGVPSSDIVGKEVLRIPWFGWITLAMKDTSWGLPLVILLIMLLVIIEFVIPLLREKKPEEEQKPAVDNTGAFIS